MPTASTPATPSPAVDASGNPTPDPTPNVLDLVSAGLKAESDLRQEQLGSVRREMELRAEHAKELRTIETARLDAIRAVDVGAVQRAAEVQATQAAALATQVSATADAFRVSMAAELEPLRKDIRELRDAQSRTIGGKDQSTDSRLNVGAILGAVSVLLVFLFGMASVAISLIR